jgi:endonuclease/exonuclease/phosphatase family metal-dependent hydrolase
VRLNVVTYNVRGFRDGPDRVGEIVERLAPDVLLLQETGPRRTLRRFAAGLGMDVAADPWSPLRRRVKDAVLVRSPWRIVEHRQRRFADAARFYPRGALIAQVGRAGRRVWAVSIHLGLAPTERNAHVHELTDLCAGLAGGPVVIGGDLNATPDERAVRWLADRYWDAWATMAAGGPSTGDRLRRAGEGAARTGTAPANAGGETFPARDPTARIDYLFASAGLRVVSARVPVRAEEASDHLPVAAELEVED